jgi:hypothetical protein
MSGQGQPNMPMNVRGQFINQGGPPPQQMHYGGGGMPPMNRPTMLTPMQQNQPGAYNPEMQHQQQQRQTYNVGHVIERMPPDIRQQFDNEKDQNKKKALFTEFAKAVSIRNDCFCMLFRIIYCRPIDSSLSNNRILIKEECIRICLKWVTSIDSSLIYCFHF